MRFGCCVGLELIDAGAQAGYDFVELPTSVLLPEEGEARFRPVADRLRSAPIRSEAWELRLPSDIKVCGPAVDWPRVSRYVNTAFRRIAAVQGAVVGLPCGGCCDVPPGVSAADALRQLCDFLRVCGAVARSQGLVVGIEALPASKPHLVNSVPDAMELARKVNMPEIGVLPNCRQIARASHSLLDIADAAAWLAHVHVSAADLQAELDSDGHLQEFSRALLLADYGGRIAVQGEWSNPKEEMARALRSLRLCFEQSRKDANG